jgi:alkylation response protein AidB-like acyl-CoA dehydrogenase
MGNRYRFARRATNACRVVSGFYNRAMNLDFSPEETAFREEVRAFIRDNYRDPARRRDEWGREDHLAWQKVLAKKGWAAPAWPREWGGTDWSPTQKFIWSEENARAETLMPQPFGLAMVGPVILAFGTEEQKQRFLPRIYSGDDWWCQGYSEPGAGSDLASLKTRAVRDGDHYIVNGQKTWTSFAQFADWGFFLVRTDPNVKKQEGISFLLIDMKSPGITIRPIKTLDGASEVNDVFLDNVKVPVSQRVGEENKGWTYAKFLLTHERTTLAGVARTKRGIERLKTIAAGQPGGDGRPLLEDPDFRRRIAELEIELSALEITELRVLANERAGRGPGVESSLLKIKGTEFLQRLTELTLDAAGIYAPPDMRDVRANEFEIGPDFAAAAAPVYFNTRKVTIYGGSNEIQRNIIAKMVLGV